MATPTEAIYINLHPFVNDPAADVIIRSSSNSVDFRVRKAVLSEASDFFKQMFTLPQANDTENDHLHVDGSFSDEGFVDGLAVIPVTEDEETTSMFLRLCYPRADHTISSLQEVKTALKTLQKYDVQYIPDSIILLLSNEAEHHPTTVYAIACGYNLSSIANKAARASLKKPLLHDTISREDFDLMSAYQYDLLLRYHTRCSDVASQTAASFDWMKYIYKFPLPEHRERRGCTCPTTPIRSPSSGAMAGSNWGMPVLNWVIEFMKECAEELKVTPCWEVLMKRGTAMMHGSVAAVAGGCVPCREEVEKLPLFAERIGRQVEFVIAEVDPPF